MFGAMKQEVVVVSGPPGCVFTCHHPPTPTNSMVLSSPPGHVEAAAPCLFTHHFEAQTLHSCCCVLIKRPVVRSGTVMSVGPQTDAVDIFWISAVFTGRKESPADMS
ncbi:hypothetical protein ILYODFUR_004446 [Ilyodon furcidens]|uniref:Uncharacterized protein n=1 Tax=Ilyodon furcidens TaxID=33524 RepID=A0ABV0TIU8_9TELE